VPVLALQQTERYNSIDHPVGDRGAGPRICIGAACEMAEAILILATTAQRYRLVLKPGRPVEPQGPITLRARHDMQMILWRRS
jgi:cytochrome P450